MKQTDWRIEQLFQAVALFDQIHILDQAIERFRKHDWVVHEFDCATYANQEELMNDVLHKTEVFGSEHTYKNIKMIQFWDLLCEAHVPEETGLALAFKNFDSFKPKYPEFFDEFFSSLSLEHYARLKRGQRWMVCAHLNDRTIRFKPVLTVDASWNSQKGFDDEADRRTEEVGRMITEKIAERRAERLKQRKEQA